MNSRRKSGLGTLLKYRKSIEDQSKIELANLMNKQKKEEEKLDDIRDAQRLAQNELKLNHQKSGAYLIYMDDLSKQSAEQKNAIKKINNEVIEKREQVIEISKARKIIEKVQEKRLEQYKQHLLKQESKMLDEIATNKFSRKDE